ncbi:hypothetical protein [Megalodesulfovibrio gigas]|uniref:hypothetical protein n=1 Tax=Megalodesulfovibrio gigas TaxID=879 RepID=UPI00040CFC10|nr:hypothetical protein [Megalodesulfovibrio gigas]
MLLPPYRVCAAVAVLALLLTAGTLCRVSPASAAPDAQQTLQTSVDKILGILRNPDFKGGPNQNAS